MTRRIPEDWAGEVGTLFASTADELFRYAATTLVQGDRAGAEDLVQSVFHDAALRWGDLRHHDWSHQRAWLFRVLKNKAIDRWRSTTRETADLGHTDHGTEHDDTHDRAVATIAVDWCWKVLRSMPAGRYRVAYLYWHEGWTSAEIATHLNIAGSTVRVQLKRARDELTRTIGSSWNEPREEGRDG